MSRPGAIRQFVPPVSSEPDLLTIDELAVKLRISVSTIHRRRRAGVFPIPHVKGLSATLQFKRVDVERFLESRER